MRSSQPRPLILAADGDPHVDAVISVLTARGVAPIHINSARLVSAGISIRPREHFVGGIDLAGVTAIWNRRFFPLLLPSDIDERWGAWCKQEYKHALLGLLFRLNVHWVSDPFRIQRASLKPLQLQVAHEQAGFNVPNYVITSEPAQARRFLGTTGRNSAVVKPLARPIVGEGENMTAVFTTRADELVEDDIHALDLAPCIFQAAIRKVAEVRVTVVGDKAFAAKIDVRDLVHVDYRRVDPYSLKHEAIEIPRDVQQGCLTMRRYHGLRFAAFDFLLDDTGGFHFLEMNPNGQWLWIQELTGLPIAEALADELCSCSASP